MNAFIQFNSYIQDQARDIASSEPGQIQAGPRSGQARPGQAPHEHTSVGGFDQSVHNSRTEGVDPPVNQGSAEYRHRENTRGSGAHIRNNSYKSNKKACKPPKRAKHDKVGKTLVHE